MRRLFSSPRVCMCRSGKQAYLELFLPKHTFQCFLIVLFLVFIAVFHYNKLSKNRKVGQKYMGEFHVMNHPLIQHKLTIIREKECGTKVFREVVSEIAMLMAYEVTRDMPLEDIEIETPLVKTTQKTLSGKKVAIIPILRAGLGMVDGFLAMLPAAKVGHIGMYRDHDTLEPVEYFVKLPTDIQERQLFIVDPMLATGGSAIAAIEALEKRGASPSSMKFICLVAAPEGVEALHAAYPDVDIYAASLDERLDENSYILPGLGDAGDRLFGTK